MAVLGAYVVLVATTPAMHEDLTPLEASWKQQIVNNGLESNDGLESTRIVSQLLQKFQCASSLLTLFFFLANPKCPEGRGKDSWHRPLEMLRQKTRPPMFGHNSH